MNDHFDGTQFFNPIGHLEKSLVDVLKWKWNSKAKDWPSEVKNQKTPNLPSQLKIGEFAITFVNHATFLIQIQTETKLVNILTDPVFSERTSPVSFAGPKRVRRPGIELENLPPVDVVIVSHNHYDHMDYDALKKLNEKFAPLFVLPLGNAKYLDFAKKPRIQERDWKEFVDIPEWQIKFHIERSHHWSRRSLTDTNKALWCAFVIESYNKISAKKIYFAGDTGYQTHFAETKKSFGNIDLALLPIGAYEPRWFMKDAHMNPEDAIKAHLDLSPVLSIGIHFGTFQLTDEGIDDPAIALEKAKNENNVSNFEILKEGETRVLF